VAFDAAGNIYGTTHAGGRIALAACTGDAVRNGTPGCGTVFKLTKQATAPWPETALYAFKGGKDGAQPSGEVTVNGAGTTITGTTLAGGNFKGACSTNEDTVGSAKGCGVVFTVTTP
jgi:hypothetical protein